MKILGGFFVSSESASCPYGSGRKFEDVKLSCMLSLVNYMGRFDFIPKVLGDLFFNNNRNILVLKYE